MEDRAIMPENQPASRGNMNGTGEMPGGEMSSRDSQAGMSQMPESEMPRGAMATSHLMTGRGQLPNSEMPAGAMQESADLGEITSIDLPGVWRLTITRISN